MKICHQCGLSLPHGRHRRPCPENHPFLIVAAALMALSFMIALALEYS